MTIDLSLPWQVIHGDCLDVMRGLPDGCVDAVVTDPPYGTGWMRTARGTSMGEFRGEFERPEWDVWDERWIVESRRFARGGAFLLPRSRLADALRAVPDARLAFYVKSNPRPNGPAVEPVILWGTVKSPGYDITAYNGDTPLHPCQKPLEVMSWMMGGVDEGALILDPFCGSGSTGVAAVQMGYRFLGIEREASYCDIARRRIADAAAQTRLAL